jgi:predicted lipid-binding transport protein (Tim44 family)
MKKALTIFTVALALGLSAAADAEAKRLGGARNSGMQKQQSSQSTNAPATQPNSPAGPAQAAPAAAGAAAAAPAAAAAKRSWAGPLTALAAGLGLAALASYFGFGEALANMMLIALVVMAVLAAIAFVMRKRAGSGPAAAMAGSGAGAGSFDGAPAPRSVRIGAALGAASAARVEPGGIPADFDVAAFVRNAKAQYTALQAANDAGDVARLRDYLTPEMFEMARQELAERGAATQRTETFGLEAQVVEVSEEADRYVVSVRFTGSTRDQAGAVPDDLDELWHLTKPRSGSGGWVVAGIQQVGTSH